METIPDLQNDISFGPTPAKGYKAPSHRDEIYPFISLRVKGQFFKWLSNISNVIAWLWLLRLVID